MRRSYFNPSILAGACVLARADKDPAEARRLRQDLEAFLTRPQDRALFDLAPQQDSDQGR